jgi:hypothetical protein
MPQVRKRVHSVRDRPTIAGSATKDEMMAKGQAKSNKEVRKPKAAKPKPPNASNPSSK